MSIFSFTILLTASAKFSLISIYTFMSNSARLGFSKYFKEACYWEKIWSKLFHKANQHLQIHMLDVKTCLCKNSGFHAWAAGPPKQEAYWCCRGPPRVPGTEPCAWADRQGWLCLPFSFRKGIKGWILPLRAVGVQTCKAKRAPWEMKRVYKRVSVLGSQPWKPTAPGGGRKGSSAETTEWDNRAAMQGLWLIVLFYLIALAVNFSKLI